MKKAWKILNNMNKARKLLEVLENRYSEKIKKRSNNRNVFKVLIRTVLSQRTKDENTKKASERLFKEAETPKQILNLSNKKLKRLIRASGMYNQKTRRIKEISKIILEKYGGKVPNKREELLKLPGVGFKTSAIVMMYGFNIPIIAVDVHVTICTQRIGLTQNEDVEEIRKDLEEIFPRNKWYLINQGLVNFGREICRTRNPKCKICPLQKVCDYYKNNF